MTDSKLKHEMNCKATGTDMYESDCDCGLHWRKIIESLEEKIAVLKEYNNKSCKRFGVLAELTKKVSNKNTELQAIAQEYYKIMSLLRDSKTIKHGLCKPRSRRACTICNAEDDLDIALSNYRGAPIVLSEE